MFNCLSLKTTINALLSLGGAGIGIHYLHKNSGTSYGLLYDKDALLLASQQENLSVKNKLPNVKDSSKNNDDILSNQKAYVKSQNESGLPKVDTASDSRNNDAVADTPRTEKLVADDPNATAKNPVIPEPQKDNVKTLSIDNDTKDKSTKNDGPTNSIWKINRAKGKQDNLFKKDKVDTYIVAKLRQPLDKTNYPKKPLYDNAITSEKTPTKSRNFRCVFFSKKGPVKYDFPFCDIQTLNMPPETKYKELTNINNNTVYAENFDDFSYYTIVLEKASSQLVKADRIEKIVVYSTQEELTINSVYGELDFLFKVKIDKKSKAASPIDQSIKHFLVHSDKEVNDLTGEPKKCKLNDKIDLSTCKIFNVNVTANQNSQKDVESFNFQYDPKKLTANKLEKDLTYLIELEEPISIKTLAKGANTPISIYDSKNKKLATTANNTKFAFVAEKDTAEKINDSDDYLFAFA